MTMAARQFEAEDTAAIARHVARAAAGPVTFDEQQMFERTISACSNALRLYGEALADDGLSAHTVRLADHLRRSVRIEDVR